jgi:hypothetical protein
MTVDALLRSCSSRELTLWQSYFHEDAKQRDEQREQAQKEAELKQWVNSA